MRHVVKIDENWYFTGFDGARTSVQLPHTWNAKDGQDGGNDYKRGTCVYDVEVACPDYKENERVYLQFHGVNSSAEVIFTVLIPIISPFESKRGPPLLPGLIVASV